MDGGSLPPSPDAQVTLSILGLEVRYDAHPALKGVSLEVREGDLWVILGPNGAGKTTLLRTIAKVLKPQSGSVIVDGKSVTDWSVSDLMKRISVVPQGTPFPFSFTVEEVVMMGRTPHLTPLAPLTKRDREAVEWAMTVTDVLSLRDRPFPQLSGGEQRRVLMAKALAQEPKTLLLDEPTANLDLRYQAEVLELIQRLNQEQHLTVISVVHDLNLGAHLGRQFLLMKAGQIVACGDVNYVMNPQVLQQVYEVPVTVSRHPVTGRPVILLTDRRIVASAGIRVHIVCGGGTGVEFLSALVSAGCSVTAGALNRGDTDYETAVLLGVPVVEEEPFTPLSERAVVQTKDWIQKADVVLLTEVPFGWGNIANLQAILESAKGLVITVNPERMAERDFVNGKAVDLLNQIFATKQVATIHSLSDLDRLLTPSGKDGSGG
ncbi:MAG: ABC transporter ATP-binding protein [Armatimonadetes bacterium]|nr:ABC transporter ATP-binding protein [Armatimonadota bacterium]MDW8122863.1 ABC transporter ATP-binding protein [Armatimonadota bacterium]